MYYIWTADYITNNKAKCVPFQRQASDLCDRTSIKHLTRVDTAIMQNRAEMHVELSEQALLQCMICLCLCWTEWEGLAVVWSVSGLFTQFNTNSSRITAWHWASSLQCNTRTERHNRTERQTVTMKQFRRWRLEHSHTLSVCQTSYQKQARHAENWAYV